MCKLRHSAPGVDELLRSEAPVVFKIGITCTPFVRWRAYEREGYQQMHLLHVTEEPGLVQMMEAAPRILNRSVRKEDLVAKACQWQNSQFVLCIVLVKCMICKIGSFVVAFLRANPTNVQRLLCVKSPRHSSPNSKGDLGAETSQKVEKAGQVA